MSLKAAFSVAVFSPRAPRTALHVQRPCSRRPRAPRARVFACASLDKGGDVDGSDVAAVDTVTDVGSQVSVDTTIVSTDGDASTRTISEAAILDISTDSAASEDADAADEKKDEEAPLYADAGLGDMGFGPSASIYDGGDDIDRSNRTFGMYNKLTERDLLLGKNVVVPGIGKEKPLKMFYRESLPTGPYDATSAVILLSGLPSSSYSYREVLPLLSKAGHRAIAPDLIGFGLSDKPAPDFEFDYTSEAYIASIQPFLDAIGVKRVSLLVSQGWLSTNGLRFALRNPDIVSAVCLLNSPLPPARPRLPATMSKWALPGFLGNAFAQDALSVEKTVEGGSYYALALEDADIYRRPAMLTGDTGFALAAASRRLDMPTAFDEIESGIADFPNPVAVATGADDRYLPRDVAERFVADVCPAAELAELEGAGHFAQEDFGERVADYLLKFIRKHDLDSTAGSE